MERARVLEEIARDVGAPRPRAGALRVRGNRREVAITVDVAPSSRIAGTFFAIQATVPGSAQPLALSILTRNGFRRPFGDPRLPELDLGDDELRQRCAVRGAPADVVHELLGAHARRQLLAFADVSIETPAPGRLRLASYTALWGLTDVRAAIDLVVSLVEGASLTQARVAERVPLDLRGAPFRPLPTDHTQRGAAARRAAEVAQLQAAVRRSLPGARPPWFFALAVGLAMVVAWVRACTG